MGGKESKPISLSYEEAMKRGKGLPFVVCQRKVARILFPQEIFFHFTWFRRYPRLGFAFPLRSKCSWSHFSIFIEPRGSRGLYSSTTQNVRILTLGGSFSALSALPADLNKAATSKLTPRVHL